MIETSLSRVKIHEVVQSQIPEFIDAENPRFGEFLKQYYISQEHQGATVDLAENLVDYKNHVKNILNQKIALEKTNQNNVIAINNHNISRKLILN